MGKRSEIKAADVEKGLKALGFKPQPQKGTSHTQWTHNNFNGKFRKVTVDSHHSPFSDDLIFSMAHQAGLSKKQFCEICTKPGQKQARKGALGWLKGMLGKG